jgi:hypothetical protein
MENKKKLLTPEELEQVAGGVLKPIQTENRYCPYCNQKFSAYDLGDHMLVCPKKPKS